jgi:transcription factor, RsfA family
MTAGRQDAWTEEEDLFLAETVLKHIREGSTQLKAFEEVGKKLNRTAAACGFRWNSTVRKRFRAEIEQAKKIRKEVKLKKANSALPPADTGNAAGQFRPLSDFTLNDVIEYLQRMKEEHGEKDQFRNEMAKLKEENERLMRENGALKKERDRLMRENKTIKNDYLSLLSIMERARKLAVEDQDAEGAEKGKGHL